MSMNDRFQTYRIWAPDDSPWSAWVKPVPFATLGELCERDESAGPSHPVDAMQIRPRPGQAVLVDLAGEESVALGMQLARAAGLRPVPIFASCTAEPPIYLQMVDTMGIQRALIRGASELPSLVISRGAAPVFLVDGARSGFGRDLGQHRYFDNRSALFPSDFPSGRKLMENGVNSCVVIRDRSVPIGEDLRYALLPWKNAGIAVTVCSLSGDRGEFSWPRTWVLARLWKRFRFAIALRRNLRGGYGRFVQESSGG